MAAVNYFFLLVVALIWFASAFSGMNCVAALG